MNALTLPVLLMISVLLLGGCAGTHGEDQAKLDKRASLHYQIGLDALHKNQLPKAFEELMLAEKLAPEKPEVLDALAYAWRLRGDEKKAEAYYKKAIRAGSGSISYTNYGSLLIEMQRYEDARTNLLKALEDPRYQGQFIANILLGDAYMGLGRYEDAIDAYRKAGRMNPKQTLTKVKEAKAFVALDRLNFAQAIYETVLRENAGNRPALEGLLEVFTRTHNRDAARRYLENYISLPSISALDRAWATDELVKLR